MRPQMRVELADELNRIRRIRRHFRDNDRHPQMIPDLKMSGNKKEGG
jgi:hypothetical protein